MRSLLLVLAVSACAQPYVRPAYNPPPYATAARYPAQPSAPPVYYTPPVYQPAAPQPVYTQPSAPTVLTPQGGVAHTDRWLNITGHIPGYEAPIFAKLDRGSVVHVADGSVQVDVRMDDGQMHFLTLDCRGHVRDELTHGAYESYAVGSLTDVAAHTVCR
jgi:hypothetical protein